MRGRGKFETEHIVLLAHTTEAMARQKRLRPAEHYLRPAPTRKAPPSAVAAMMQRMERAGLSVAVRKIPAKERNRFNGGRDARLP